jgi:hypothetical protein
MSIRAASRANIVNNLDVIPYGTASYINGLYSTEDASKVGSSLPLCCRLCFVCAGCGLSQPLMVDQALVILELR